MSIYNKATLVQIPSGYNGSTAKLYSVLPANGDGDFTVSADADATRIDENGLIESTVANQARLSRNFIDGVVQPDPFLLLEPTRTNQILYSEDFTNAVWQKLGGGTGIAPVVTANYSTAPNGSNTADRVVMDMGSGTTGDNYSIIRNFGTSGSTGTNSIYIKSNTTDSYTIGIDNVGTVETITVTPQWKRFSYSDTTSDRLQISLRGTGSSTSRYADVSMWGGSLENGTYVTSYIPTTSASVTRTEDSCEVASGLENIIGQTEGTLFIDFEYLYETTTDSSTDANRDILVLGTASDISEGVSIDNYRSQFRVFVQGSGMTTQSIGNNSAGASQPNTRYKLAVKYKTGDCKAYLNGSLLGSSTGTVSFATNLDGIFFSYNSGSRPYKNQKKVYQLMYFDTALTDSELQTLTSYDSFGQMAKALLYTIE
jgi:hypothetical protein